MANKPLNIIDRKGWRKWLASNFDKKKEAWLIYPKKSSGKPRILYNDAVEESLCFGWIDSINKKLDEHHTMQRFTPRKKGSKFSQANKERLRWLLENNMIHPDFLDELKQIVDQEYKFPIDIINKLKEDQEVWKIFTNFSDAYKRIRVEYIESARNRPEEFQKRLSNFIEKTKVGKQIKGYGGIDKYY